MGKTIYRIRIYRPSTLARRNKPVISIIRSALLNTGLLVRSAFAMSLRHEYQQIARPPRKSCLLLSSSSYSKPPRGYKYNSFSLSHPLQSIESTVMELPPKYRHTLERIDEIWCYGVYILTSTSV